MSCQHGELQKLIKLNYDIPYAHCFNHRLHLAVEAVISNVHACRLFFGVVRLIHNFFSRSKVRREYLGTNIPHLIEHRSSGHL